MMGRRFAHKIRMAQGFTLVEMLAALAVLSIMTAMVATGVSAGVRAYENSQFTSQAEMLAATIDNTLSEPFRFMRSGSADGEFVVDFENQNVTIKASPRALVSDEYGKVYLSGKVGSETKQIKVVNDGIYGGCKVSFVTSSSESCSMDKVEYRYVISNASGTMSRNYSFVVKPLEGVTRDYSVNSSAGDGGDGGGGNSVDKTALLAEIELASSALEADQKAAAATAALRNALSAAETVRDKQDATTSEVQKATDNLKAARLAYELGEALPNIADLIAAINRAPASFDDRFDSSALARVRNAYNAAVSQRDNPTSQSKVDEATSELNAALDAYEAQRYTAALSSAITSAESALQTERIDRDGITAALNNALADARAVASNPANYSQAQIDQYATALQSATTAYNGLEKKPSGGGEGGYDVTTDPNAPKNGAHVTSSEIAYSSYISNADSWSQENAFTWKVDKTGDVAIMACDAYGQYYMVYYRGVYYTVTKYENDSYVDTSTILSSSFKVSDLTDGLPHDYGWGARYWRAN